jgi:hypothetical protein
MTMNSEITKGRPAPTAATLRKCFLGAAGAAALTLSAGTWADSDCAQPDMPMMPDGASATLEQMLEGQQAVKAFQSANMDYMKCLEAAFEAASETARDAADDAAKNAAEEEHSATVDLYNAAVSAEEEVAGAFNIELREYRAANK